MADEELELDVTQAKGNKMTNILLISLIVLVLIIGGVGGWLLLSKGDKAGESSSATGEKEKKNLKPLKYLTLVPEFVINFGPGSKVRYLQIDLQVASRDESALSTMNVYMPVIRNDILVLLSGQTFEDLKSRAGKEALQKKILNKLNLVITKATSEEQNKEESNADVSEEITETAQEEQVIKGPIENVYFTSFIMQ